MLHRATLACLFVLTFSPFGKAQCTLQELGYFGGEPELWVTGFGASIRADGDFCIVGAPESLSGTAIVFRRNSDGWQKDTALLAADGKFTDSFGSSVAIDGDQIVVGAPRANAPLFDSGAAYVFQLLGGLWWQTAKLTANDAGASDMFGWSVAISGDRIIVGAPNHDNGIVPDAGAVYVFERSGPFWNQTASIHGLGYNNTEFGKSIDLDGDIAAIGEPGAKRFNIASNHSGTWQIDLVDFGPGGTTAMGTVVAIKGGTAAATNSSTQVGSIKPQVLVFEKTGVTSWAPSGGLIGADIGGSESFGDSIAIANGTIAVGSATDDDFGAGSVFVFVKSVAGWVETNKSTPAISENGQLSGIGRAIAFAGDEILSSGRLVNNPALPSSRVYELPASPYVAPNTYGNGCPGSGGFVPLIATSGCSARGGGLTFAIDKGLGGSITITLFGLQTASIPIAGGCTMLIAPVLPPVILLPLYGVGPGSGSIVITGLIPSTAQIASITMQTFVADPGVIGGMAVTNGIQMTIQ